jgi:hypothetical protein
MPHPKNPIFVTQLIKSLLKEEAECAVQVNIEAGNKLAERINCLITDFRNRPFVRMADSNS